MPGFSTGMGPLCVGLISREGSSKISCASLEVPAKDVVLMSIELAEKLKQKLTDKWVMVDSSVPELRRFANWTGKVKTVNMSCRALVEFDGPVDIGWYDIDPAFLTVVDGPRPKAAPEAKAKAAAPAAEKKPAAAAKPAGLSPLEAARAQGAAKAGAAPAAAAPAAVAPVAGKKPSPLDMIRKQGAAKPGGAATPAAPTPEPAAQAAPAPATATPAEPPAAAAPAATAPTPTTTPDGRKLSPLELARMQGAAKR
jgi:hypothetical protein